MTSNIISLKSISTTNLQEKQIEKAVSSPSLQAHFDKAFLTSPGKIIDEVVPLVSEQEIISYSLLYNEKVAVDEKLSQIITLHGVRKFGKTILALLTNYLGGGRLTGGSGERDGVSPVLNYAVWEHLISQLQESVEICETEKSLPSLLINLQKGLSELKSYAEKAIAFGSDPSTTPDLLSQGAIEQAKKIRALSIGQSLLIHGGWSNRSTGGGGHAQIYEILRRDENGVDLHIYTSTALHQEDHFLVSTKRRQAPVIKYCAIPLDHFLLCSGDREIPLFLQGLLEVRVLSSDALEKNVDDQLFLRLISIFESYRIDVPFAESGAVTGLRGGTCAPSSTKIWIRQRG